MPKKIKYNNPYYLELLKSLIILVNKGKDKYRDGLSVKERWSLSNRKSRIQDYSGNGSINIDPDHLARILQKKLTKKAHYSLEPNSLDELVKYISSSYNYKDYYDFVSKENCTFANQFDGSKHFFDYSDVIKEEVREKVEDRVKEILEPKSGKNINTDSEQKELGTQYLKIDKNNNGTEKAIQILDKIKHYDIIIQFRKLTSFEEREAIRCIQYDQGNLIKELESLVVAKPHIVTPLFIEILGKMFIYEWGSPEQLKSCSNRLTLIKRVIKTQQKRENSDIFNIESSLVRATWSLGDNSHDDIYADANKQLDNLLAEKKIDEPDFQKKKLALLDYGCGDMLQVEKYRTLANRWEGNECEKLDLVATTRQCSACQCVRDDKFEEAEDWLDMTKNSIIQISKDTNIDVNKKIAYYYFIHGALNFRKREYNLAYEYAEEARRLFMDHPFKKDPIEPAFIYYIIYKTGLYLGKHNEAEAYGRLAHSILANSISKKYCLFDYQEVFDDLDKNFNNKS